MTLHKLMDLFPAADAPRWTWYTQTFKPDATLYSELADLYAMAPEIATIGVTAGQASNASTDNALGLDAVDQI
ncbi:hypothetical protein F5Y03DRAFT_21945 [Xylaria venustula]|nr:hypothetical protein F5Y03DRAFT_21945 [Xylaria venustula]